MPYTAGAHYYSSVAGRPRFIDPQYNGNPGSGLPWTDWDAHMGR